MVAKHLSEVHKPAAAGPNDGGHWQAIRYRRLAVINTTWWGVWVPSDVHQNGIYFSSSLNRWEESVKLIGQNCRGIYWLIKQKNEERTFEASTCEADNVVFLIGGGGSILWNHWPPCWNQEVVKDLKVATAPADSQKSLKIKLPERHQFWMTDHYMLKITCGWQDLPSHPFLSIVSFWGACPLWISQCFSLHCCKK